MKWKIPLFKIHWDENDVDAVSKTIKRGMFWTCGPDTLEFEKMMSDFLGASHALAFNSGTSALHALLIAHGIKNTDEVIVPSFTFPATVNSVLFVGAKPVFADIEEETLGIDPVDVRKKITEKTKAIIAVHYGGSVCKINELKEIAEEKNILLIEDAAGSFGSSLNGKKAGTFGNSSILSFCQNKVVTCGEGGAAVTDSKEIYEKLKLIRSHGRAETKNYFDTTSYLDYISLGYNFRISEIAAALGISQLKKINQIINMRRDNAKYLDQLLSEIKQIKIQKPAAGVFHTYQMYSVRVEKRDELMKYLENKEIMTKAFFSPVHLTGFYKGLGHREGELPVTEKVAKEILTLPFYADMKKTDMDFLVKNIKDWCSNA